ncbi:MAG: CDP-alcohol phosphatidyltransferase family protein [Actinomycetota bacterium]
MNDVAPDPQQEGPRVRDLPAPRKNRSAAGGTLQRSMAWPYRAILAFLLWTRIRPLQLTLLSLLLNVVSGALILRGAWFAAGVVLLAAGLADVFDGSVARQRGTEGRSGAFMDSVLDRIADMILFSALFWVLAERGETVYAALALVTLVVSLLVSHIRAEAEAAGLSLTEGFFQRLERFLALMAGLVIPGAMEPVLVVLAALGAVTILQRLWSAVRQLA